MASATTDGTVCCTSVLMMRMRERRQKAIGTGVHTLEGMREEGVG
jgi:hypothetical protein